jgi:hypothetical protein
MVVSNSHTHPIENTNKNGSPKAAIFYTSLLTTNQLPLTPLLPPPLLVEVMPVLKGVPVEPGLDWVVSVVVVVVLPAAVAEVAMASGTPAFTTATEAVAEEKPAVVKALATTAGVKPALIAAAAIMSAVSPFATRDATSAAIFSFESPFSKAITENAVAMTAIKVSSFFMKSPLQVPVKDDSNVTRRIKKPNPLTQQNHTNVQ